MRHIVDIDQTRTHDLSVEKQVSQATFFHLVNSNGLT